MFNVQPEELYSNTKLIELDCLFLHYVQSHNTTLYNTLLDARNNKFADSDTIIELSYILEKFIAKLFHIQNELNINKKQHEEFSIIYKCKRIFVQRYALKKYKTIDNLNIKHIIQNMKNIFHFPIQDYDFAQKTILWLEEQELYSHHLDIVAQYAAYMVYSNSSNSILFQVPKKINFANLIPVVKDSINTIDILKLQNINQRLGFNSTHTPTLHQSLNNVHYCIFCHKQNKDSCSKGLLQDNQFKYSPLGTELHGCPVEEKISEMNFVRSQGFIIAPLAIAIIDNPLCVLTGHRICNDCMKSCIYQKQDPVDIPAIETHILDSVLNLSYGFEIYSLLTKWNPLNIRSPLPQPNTNKNVLIVGLGPAGISLAHYLLNDGHNVIAIDGLKIEPLPEHISGVTPLGKKVKFQLIKNTKTELYEDLNNRIAYGFGGVSEYGITARWNKNYLKIARLLLERRENFAMYGGIRFGSNITIDNAFDIGFHHIALAAGSGNPHIIQIKNSLARGVRIASDFLMSLQLTGAARDDSIANLQIRLPAVIIGGGLTAVDTATELLAYYPIQVEKFLLRYETLVKKYGKQSIEENWNQEEKIIANEFINHAYKIKYEKAAAQREKRTPRIIKLLQNWGGVTIIYRGNLCKSQSYKLNSQELQHALSEGIYFAENLQPIEIITDKYNHASKVKVIDTQGNHKYIIAKNVIIATGTSPNLTTLKESGVYLNNNLNLFNLNKILTTNINLSPKNQDKDNIFLSQNQNISIFGDLHPSYRGSVVKAIASAKNGYQAITQVLKNHHPCKNSHKFFHKISTLFISRIVKIEHLTSKVIKLTIRSPTASYNFEPGQFYRLQNFEYQSINIHHDKKFRTKLSMEGLALTGVSVDKKNGLISTIVLKTGGSADLCYYLKKKQPVILMGPTGSPTQVPIKEQVMLIGGGVGNAVLLSVGKALISNGCKVLYFAGYKNANDTFYTSDIEEASNIVIWCCENGHIIPKRSQDTFYSSNIIQGIINYQKHYPKLQKIQLNTINRAIIIGSHHMMKAVSHAINNVLKPLFHPNINIITSINSPMQCMMKGICAQCLQKHINPLTKEEFFVYSCINQDQKANYVDFEFLDERLKQNSLQEKCTSKWIDYCLNSKHSQV
ncbi:FAD-dependent oxidoreductase [Candidatus Neoehrlichia procyonis]|uniref:Pyridine nucleotide-disulfide oxidoreductase family protein n=1 Tax=Candidatus Neoehrlichia procyonis str. RAC413 TaxID=1359163 RepID=A0A0F3NLY1_9RICK|nr:FAD-dependent oxidoreductase [Candidatus Neoehrlichia lotoris]KJV68707.1 pyridine nucleotide-disulfide oxidoreductase family protein [Candidatus Neoehrlichia lotoris str. RAC413]